MKEWKKGEHLGGQISGGRQRGSARACSIKTVCVGKELLIYTILLTVFFT